MLYKIIHHIVDSSYNHGITRGHDFKLTVPFTYMIDTYKFSFFPATITSWNKLPNEIVNATSIDTFVDLLSDFNFD